MVEVRRKEHESAGSMLRRFTRRVQLSGFLTRVRGAQYRERVQSDFKKKKSALYRIARQKETARLRKLGKM
ncbi:hypothetical protein HYT01_02330 [Candidatus Giovannonibacteria bacterium]|nr:hypothetical protein [Candidatus Giovannonibacteria bacterium]